MTCVHLRQLYKLCEENDLRLGGSDLIRIMCTQCGEQEVCPNTLTDEYDAKNQIDREEDSKQNSQETEVEAPQE